MNTTRPSVLYISYDGMLEPLGQSQVIAYLERLSDEFDFHLLSFEKPADLDKGGLRSEIRHRLASHGIQWHPLTYHKRPTVPATLLDIIHGIAVALWLIVRHKVGLVHARSYVAGLIAFVVTRLTPARFLFDIRGFWADERTDGGLWPKGGRLYRVAKRVERTLLGAADHIVTLTESSVPHLRAMPGLADRADAPVTVITTCADLERFSPSEKVAVGPFVLGYLGSVGTWYMFDELLEVFGEIRRRLPDARLLIVNRLDHDLIRKKLETFGIGPESVELVAVDHAEAPQAIRRMTAGTAIIRPVFSKISSAPTKLAEYLGCGVPCLANGGVGDMAVILESNKVGVALTDFSKADRDRAVTELLELVNSPGLAERCRETALRLFSLDRGVEAYRSIYRGLLGSPPNRKRASA